MGMFVARIYIQVFEQCATQAVFGQHTAYRRFHGTRRVFRQYLFWRIETLATRITGVPLVHFVFELVASQLYFVCIDHDHVVAAVYVWGVRRLVFPPDYLSNLR